MAQTKTMPTGAAVADYLSSRASEAQRADCTALMKMLRKVTGEEPKMWGPSIVGFGSYRYTYESGRTGESCAAGFAIRGRELVVYLAAQGSDQASLLSRLGKYRMGKSCLYFKRIEDLDVDVLEALVVDSLAELRRRHPPGDLGGVDDRAADLA